MNAGQMGVFAMLLKRMQEGTVDTSATCIFECTDATRLATSCND